MSEVITLSQNTIAEVTQEKDLAIQIRAAAAAIQIRDEPGAVKATQELKALHERHKALEAKRVSIKAPINAAAKAVEDLFREPLASLEIAKGAISRALGSYNESIARAKQAALNESRAQTATPEQSRALLVAGTEQPTRIGGTREVESVEITITDASLIPREFCTPSESLLRQAHNQSGGRVVIPGVVFVVVKKIVPTGR